MSSIESINQKSGAIQYSGNKSMLSEKTKQKLEELGIDPNNVSSENEARKLIKNKESQEAPSSGEQKSGNQSGQELYSQAKNLATKVGASVSDNDKLDDILAIISDKINNMLKSATNDPEKNEKIYGFKEELNAITQANESNKSYQSNLFSAMNMVSRANKMSLGLS